MCHLVGTDEASPDCRVPRPPVLDTRRTRGDATSGEKLMVKDQSAGRRSPWLAAICLAGGIGALAAHASAGEVLVDPANMGTWIFQQDPGTTGAGSFVTGPGTPPLGTGSAQLSETDLASSEILFNYLTDVGTPLSQITALSYSEYIASNSGDDDLAPSLQFNVNINSSTTAYQGRLVYEPYFTNTLTPGTWQSWNTMTGADWWFSSMSFNNGCTQANPCTWAQVLADYPDVVINNTVGGFGFKVGSRWPSFVGNVDDLTITVSSVSTTYNFDPNPSPAPEPASLALLGTGLLGVAALRRRRTNA
jgi:PEP-CTERM motif